MALLATLHDHRRAAERQPLDVDATLRLDGRPLDALIANISTSGCLFVCSEALLVGDTVTIGIAGIGRRQVRIVRALGSRFGAEFEVPLTAVEIEAVAAAPGEVVVSLSPSAVGPFVRREEEEVPPPTTTAKLPVRARLAVIGGLTLASWCALIPALRALG